MYRNAIYKLKDNVDKNIYQDLTSSEYIYINNFAYNPFKNSELTHCVFKNINIETMELFHGFIDIKYIIFQGIIDVDYIMPIKDFTELFDLYMKPNEIGSKIRSLTTLNHWE